MRVNGNAGDVGTQFALPSGALLTVNADGTSATTPTTVRLSAAPGSGASNLTATDSFTYTMGGDRPRP